MLVYLVLLTVRAVVILDCDTGLVDRLCSDADAAGDGDDTAAGSTTTPAAGCYLS